MEPRRYLRCLGHPALVGPGGEPIRLRTRKHLGLLVFLAVEKRQAHRRDRLAELLWPGASMAEARHSLATALSMLRPRVGRDLLETGREQVRLQPGGLLLDLDRLLRGDVLGDELSGPLEVAGFLEGFDIPDAVEFTLWKDRQQARLLPAIKAALVVLMDRSRRCGDFLEIERLADRMLALDELSEEAIRAKMEARALAGDRLTGLRLYEAWRAKLGSELQAVPSALVEGMAIRLRRRGGERTAAAEIPSVPTDQWRGRAFVGRGAEYRVLYEAWEATRRGEPAHVLVLGDSGVGKTTLVERFTTAAGLEGAAISRVQCYDLEREIPYSTVSGLVLGLLDRPGVTGTPPEALAELARTVPEVRRRFPGVPPSSESQGETARIRLTEAFHEMLLAVGEEHPVILVVDDLHLADDASLAVLHLVLRRARGQPIQMLFVARPGDLARSPQATRLRENGPGLGLRELELAPLGEEESTQLLATLVPPERPQPSASARRALLRGAGGYPMVLELLVQDWQTSGDRSLALSVDAMTVDPGSAEAGAGVYRRILARLTRALDQGTLNLLHLAAVLGRRLTDWSMYAIVDLTVGQTVAAMTELVDRRILRDGGQGLEFVNELVRGAAYLAIPGPLRRLLHSQIADRFIEAERGGGVGLGLEIAWHCVRAGRAAESIPYLLRGARDAIRCGSLDAAERSLSTALPHLTGEDRVQALLLLIQVLQEQSRWSESLALLEDEALPRDSEQVRIFAILARRSAGTSTAADLVSDLGTLGDIIGSGANPAIRVRAARASGRLLGQLHDAQIASELLRRTEDIPEAELDDDHRILLALTRALLLFQSHQREASLSSTLRLMQVIQAKGVTNSTTLTLCMGLGALDCHQGQYSDAKPHFLRAHAIALQIGNDHEAVSLVEHIALCCCRLGEYEEVLKWSETVLTPSPNFGGRSEVCITYYAALAGIFRERQDNALDLLRRLEQKFPPSAPAWLFQTWQLMKGDVYYLLGDRANARTAARAGLGGVAPRLHSMSCAGGFARWLALVADSPERRTLAERDVSQVREFLRRLDVLSQAEVLCADVLLAPEQASLQERQSRLAKRLANLPPAVREQLRRLGAYHP